MSLSVWHCGKRLDSLLILCFGLTQEILKIVEPTTSALHYVRLLRILRPARVLVKVRDSTFPPDVNISHHTTS